MKSFSFKVSDLQIRVVAPDRGTVRRRVPSGLSLGQPTERTGFHGRSTCMEDLRRGGGGVGFWPVPFRYKSSK